MKKPAGKIFANIMLVVLVLFCTTVTMPARADLMIAPLRIFFGPQDRTAEITLINTANDTNTYRVQLIHNLMNETGGYTEQQTSIDPNFDISQMVVFSPRQVTIPPGGRQKIRVTAKRLPNLAEGEYHAHLRMQRIAQQKGSDLSIPEEGMRMGVAANLGFAIPIILRHGAQNVQARITAARFIPAAESETREPQMEVTLERTGKHGTIGKIIIFWQKPDGSEALVGQLNNAAIFTELSRRIARINLRIGNIVGGKMRVVYMGEGPDSGQIFDERLFPVGG